MTGNKELGMLPFVSLLLLCPTWLHRGRAVPAVPCSSAVSRSFFNQFLYLENIRRNGISLIFYLFRYACAKDL